jgi:hypothetical protein
LCKNILFVRFPRKHVWTLSTATALENVDLSHSMCDCISSVSKKCHNLVQHSGTICNSLIVKTYQSQFDELSEFDCGKIIMFIKVKDNGVTSIKKFVLLGPEMEES